jgi:hypothetical protein
MWRMETESPTLSLNEYAESVGVHPRTVKRWLANDEVPDAVKDPFTNEWRFPPGAPRVQRALSEAQAPGAQVSQPVDVLFGGPAGAAAGGGVPWWAVAPPALGSAEELEPTRLDMLDEESAFLTIERAARFLGVPQAQIRANGEVFGLMPVGINGSLMVPKSTIRKFEGK